jgi:serine protease Do
MLTRIVRPAGSACLVATVLGLGSVIPAAGSETIAELFGRVHRSVVVVRSLEMDVPAGEGRGPSVSSIGSGILISRDGKILTAAHLVHAASEITVGHGHARRPPPGTVDSASATMRLG